MSDGLMECPFCGGESPNLYINGSGGTYWVECSKCGSEHGGAFSKESAIKAWNTRYERTCTDVGTQVDYWQCSECGVKLENPVESPTLWDGYKAIEPRYCPKCKARVVGD